MPRLLVDANIFLELELSQSKCPECKDFLRSVASGRLKAATTDFILDSVAAVMEDRDSSSTDIRTFFGSLTQYKGLLIHNLGVKGRLLAVEEMERDGLDFDDSTSVAAMKMLGVKEIVSYDHDFDKVHTITRTEPKTVLSRFDGSKP